MSVISSFIIFVILFSSCVSTQPVVKNPTVQVIETKSQFYDTVGNQFSKPFMIFKEKVWYTDSMAIESVSSHDIITDAANITTEKVIIMHYRFSDLRTKSVYEYKNFSDTARLIRKYSYDDTTVVIYSGWNFKWIRKVDYIGSLQTLPDTIIDKINYKRVSLFNGTQDNPFLMICYFRCDKKGTIFTSNQLLSEMNGGCPVVKSYNFSLFQKGAATSSEINFLAEKFTIEEAKVFDAWKKYAKANPVNK